MEQDDWQKDLEDKRKEFVKWQKKNMRLAIIAIIVLPGLLAVKLIGVWVYPIFDGLIGLQIVLTLFLYYLGAYVFAGLLELIKDLKKDIKEPKERF